MASCTPRIILTLAVPIFGFLTILFLKRKKLKSSDLKNLTQKSAQTDDLTTSMKLQPDYSTVVQSAKTEDMQLKENESNSSSLSNGVANLPKQIRDENGIFSATNGISSATNGISSAANGISSAANGISSATNGISSATNGVSSQNQTIGQCRASYAAALKINKNVNGTALSVKTLPKENGTALSVKTLPKENGTGINVQPAKADKNCNQNGLKKQVTRTQQNSESTNSVSECASSPKLNKPNEVLVVTTSNGVNQINKPKSKKRGKGKMPEKNNTCSTEPTSESSVKDNVLVKTDNKNTLSQGFSNLTVDDTSMQEIVHATDSQEMNLNSCPTNSVIEHVTSSENSVSDTQTITSDGMPSLDSESVVHIAEDLTIATAKECDIVDQAVLAGSHCVTPESGRSSETLSETAETLQIDVNGDLTFSDDCIAVGGQDMLPSPEAAYCDSLSLDSLQLESFEVAYKGYKIIFQVSRYCVNLLKNIPYICKWTHLRFSEEEGSNDSGRGGSELQFALDSQPYSMTYEFDLHADHCGYLIGKRGSHVNYIKEKTNALIWIRNSLSPFNNDKKVVSIIAGDEASINEALKLVRKRFPLSQYPDVTLERSDRVLVCPPTLKLTLPEGVEFQVVLSATMNAAHFFVQLPTHPSYHALPPFTLSMTSLYTHCHAPVVTTPTIGNIVVAPVGDGWFRAEIMEVFTEDETCRLKYLDYGGYQIVPTATLRQINFEFMQMPFQAIECYLANVTCHEELGWTEESKIAFETVAQGQILSAYVAGVAENGVPCLHLYKVTGATNTFINQALVDSGYAKWVSYEQ